MSDADLDVGSKQALASSFRDLARYALRKTKRDERMLGVRPEYFTVVAIEESLAAEANAGIFGSGAPSLKALLAKAKRSPITFLFHWTAHGVPRRAAFELSYAESDWGVKVRLLWLGLPEKVPVAPRVGIIDGRQPLEEAVFQLLRVGDDGGIEPYPPPE
jgi:hypothetical protein